MFLVLEVTSPNAAELGPAARMVFSMQGGTIGRRAGNDWILPDGHVSGRHARIRAMGGTFFLEDNESANGVRVNGTLLHAGEPYPLKEGDAVFIDPYEISVRISATKPSGITEVLPVPPVVAKAPDATPVRPGPVPTPGSLEEIIQPQGLGDETNELLRPLPSLSVPQEPVRPRAEDLVHVDPLRDALRVATPIPQDWWKEEPEFSAAPPAPEFPAEAAPRPSVAPPPPVAPPVIPIAPPVAAPSAAALPDDLRALLKGAGIEAESLDPRLLEQLGEVLRIVIANLMEVLQERGKIKSEFRLQQTTFKPRENNPLKFSANVEDALHNLLVKRNAAYLEAPEAFEDAFMDVRHHQFAMLAGMRAAFDYMLARFDPTELAAHIDAKPGRRLPLGISSSGRYWDGFVDYYRQMTQDADDCFRRLFGDQFARAYEEQLQRLRAEKYKHGETGRDR